jgi:type VI protein secretion system component Hcp
MPATMFVRIGDDKEYKGDSIEKNHLGWLVVSSLSWSVARVSEEENASAQRGFGKSVFEKVELESELGDASMGLMTLVANGTYRKEIEIHQCRSGADPKVGLEPYLIWKLKDCYLQDYSVDGSEDSVPKEKWSIKYTKIEVEYKKTDITSGALNKHGDFKWDLAAGAMG